MGRSKKKNTIATDGISVLWEGITELVVFSFRSSSIAPAGAAETWRGCREGQQMEKACSR